MVKENETAAGVPNTENNVNAAATGSVAAANVKEMPINNDKDNDEDLRGLARLFLKEYYTKLSDRPEEAGNFYGEDSHLVHSEVEEMGRKNIQLAIAKLGFEDCKARFYSLKVVPLPMQGDNAKLIQVCGELTQVEPAVQKQQPALPRRFVQTIILAHQTPTVLYVKSNVFQWLDTAFLITTGEKYNAANNAGATVPSPPTTVAEHLPPLENGGQVPTPADVEHLQQQPLENGAQLPTSVVEQPKPLENGGHQAPTPMVMEKKQTPAAVVDSLPSPPSTPNKKEEEAASAVAAPPAAPVIAVVDEPPKSVNASPPLPLSQPVAASPGAAAAPTPPAEQPQQQQPMPPNVTTGAVIYNNNTSAAALKPKSAISGSYAAIAAAARGQPMHAAQPPRNVVVYQQQHQQAMPPPPQQQQKPPPVTPLPQQPKQQPDNANEVVKQQPPPHLPSAVHVAPRREWAHRIYFSQLAKPGRFVDFKKGQQEMTREIRAITDGVEFVGIKPNSLRREYRTAFGFIDFTTAADVQAVYDACKNDPSSNSFTLNVRIPEFDFNGDLLLSADKTNNLGSYGGGGGYR